MPVRPAFAAFFALLTLLVPAAVLRQPAPQPLTVTWQDGFVFQSADGSFRLELHAVAQADGRFSLDDPTPITNTFTVRKARPIVSGRLGRYFDFRLMPEFAGGSPVMLDAYLDMRFSKAFRLRAGKDKAPVGYELLIGDANLFFPERALPSGLVPNRDVGFQAQGDVAGQKISYSGGIFNGVADGVTSTTDVDGNGAKDFAGRVIVQPFRPGGAAPATALSGLGFHLGASAGSQLGTLPSYRTSIGQTYFAYAPGTAASGTRRRVTPAVFYFFKSLGAFGEYVRSTQEIARTARTHIVTNHGGTSQAPSCSPAKWRPREPCVRFSRSIPPRVIGVRCSCSRATAGWTWTTRCSTTGWRQQARAAVRTRSASG